mmetsp:Transcript_107676/g.335779  ORF Transcript_107676/g.335779 Transcript_107676/m.335779 type:complete len:351 (+) Transcript_107676:39-1091(+)|eukprot:CAMPEP_0204608006 /NCGR_PEP_ID=MMETSP0661-20131031/60056_1 /ASSEMBLY_ACC=CAM_ASM_000606 /TAXON_ID=109239 /ORGANISM="Alexandrium margalefi, Strain AMGDE01CS-322" /LENGTH=350 /DNA_ID=CAMNT_0051619475 /DNA_START=38 /DNA_END=1090 /DNA_ORIENTATION=-
MGSSQSRAAAAADAQACWSSRERGDEAASQDGPSDVVVIGSCNTDLVAFAPRLPKEGETLTGTEFKVLFGGKGANQAVMAARLGAKTAMVGKVGRDSFGRDTLQNFRDVGVNVQHVTRTIPGEPESTGVAQICVGEGENHIVIIPGANGCISESDVQKAQDVFQGAKVILAQLETSLDRTLQAFRLAKAAEAPALCVLTPAPAVPLPDEAFELTDIVCPNQSETELLTGLPCGNEEEAAEAAKALMAKGCKKVLISMGAKGALVCTPQGATPVACPEVAKENVVDTTGAGDALVGSLAHILAAKPDIELVTAVEAACALASLTVQAQGAQASYPSHADPRVKEILQRALA